MKINIKKLLKKLLLLAFIIYVTVTIINQQKVLDTYEASIATVEEEIDEANEYKESLVSLKENANSLEYIEKIAREKLNMYMPDEKVYIDVRKLKFIKLFSFMNFKIFFVISIISKNLKLYKYYYKV